MSKPIKFLVIHCTDTPKGRNVGSTDIKQWHLGPLKQKDGSFIYKGNKYATLSALPVDKIGGVSITKLTGRGWKQVGYSDLIHINGNIENLVPYNDDAQVDAWEVTNGVAGINGVTRHIVYVGGRSADMKKAEDTRTNQQKAVLLAYVKKMIELVPGILVAGHYQFDAKKACPSFDVPAWLAENKIATANIYTGGK
jgi:N-acetylmuramoyl-L-alanine amidase